MNDRRGDDHERQFAFFTLFLVIHVLQHERVPRACGFVCVRTSENATAMRATLGSPHAPTVFAMGMKPQSTAVDRARPVRKGARARCNGAQTLRL